MAETIKIQDVPDASVDMTLNGDNKSRGKGLIFFYILDFLSRVNMMVLRRDLWPACIFAKDKFSASGNTHAATNAQRTVPNQTRLELFVRGIQRLHNACNMVACFTP